MRAFWARHPRLVDSLLAALCWVWVFDDAGGLRIPQPVEGAWWTVNTVVAATMLIRRSRPWWAVLAVTAAGTLLSDHFVGVALACALYALAAYRPTRDAMLGAVLAVTVLAAAVAVNPGPRSWQDTAVAYTVIAVISVLPGLNVRIRRRYLQALLDRTEQLAREKEQEGRLAAARERTRIAHDLHDIVAHSLTVMVRLADGAAAVARTDPARAESASERIAGVGRTAMVDMRRLLGVLRDGPPGEDARPAQDLDTLVATFRGAGLPVTVDRQGPEPASPSLRNAIFRTVQESLTNALRYADGAQKVLVGLDYRADPILVEVTDDGQGSGPASSVGARQGLIALRERISLYGGTVLAGPRAEHGWAVHVTLPQPDEGS
ncbi:sensor histidine kinase [Catenuloplanes japonicus]|uniref:sensor histidine kinase n=1 Tax=Catenuloplanes japonicus TaxID=33876 RepID=UPI00052755A0|nr:histidine kinase [Catenuloplanes japonicus]